jgi:hypothetical protein
MNFDITGGLVPFEIPSDAAPSARGAGSASAGPASPGGEAASASPLSYFGDMIQQIGRSMTADTSRASASGEAQPQSMHEAIDLLESVIGMMSLYGSSDEMMARLQSGDMPKLDTL